MMIAKKRRQIEARRRGLVMALAAVLMPVVVGAMALALDCGVMYLQRRQAQTAADAAALAGAYALYNGSNASVARSAAIAVGAQNGFTIPSSNVTPTTTTVAVQVTATPPRFFSALWGQGRLSISASAKAATDVNAGSTPYSNYAILVLDPTSSGSLTLSNNTEITTSNQINTPTGTGIQVNSSSPTAAVATNSAYTDVPVSIVGGYSTSNSAYFGSVTTGAPVVPDPLASLPVPSVPTATSTPSTSYSGNGTYTMQPGLYTQSVTISNPSVVTMQPGLYYFQNGASLTIESGGGLNGSGVTLYMDGGGTINFTNLSSTTLSAPTSGTYQGVVYFQDRTSTTTPTFGNNATINLSGTFYAPAAAISFQNNMDYAQYGSQLIVKDLSLANYIDVNIPWSASTVAAKGNYAYPVSLIQ